MKDEFRRWSLSLQQIHRLNLHLDLCKMGRYAWINNTPLLLQHSIKEG